jgi:hypothetical protein
MYGPPFFPFLFLPSRVVVDDSAFFLQTRQELASDRERLRITLENANRLQEYWDARRDAAAARLDQPETQPSSSSSAQQPQEEDRSISSFPEAARGDGEAEVAAVQTPQSEPISTLASSSSPPIDEDDLSLPPSQRSKENERTAAQRHQHEQVQEEESRELDRKRREMSKCKRLYRGVLLLSFLSFFTYK